MRSHPDPERPEDLETRPSSAALPDDAGRPDWLVGADDVLEGAPDAESSQRRSVAEVPSAPAPLRVVEGRKPETLKAWSGAASSVPKLTVVPATENREQAEDENEDEPSDVAGPSLVSGDEVSPPTPRGLAFRPLDEPWYLVWAEALATRRRVQLGLFALVLALAMFFLWPRGGAQGTSLSGILNHPERFEGQTVAVRGEVMEIFEVGQGFAFQLRQGRSMVVVYSMVRQPRLHERVEVRGTVSTGYLDGSPRVAIFEGGAP